MRNRLVLATLLVSFASDALAHAQCTSVAFHAPVHYPVSASVALFVADLNGDQAPEILTSGTQVEQLDALSVLPNRGDGTFAAEQLIATGGGERLEDVADLDRDGIPDLLTSAYWRNGIAFYRGLGNLQFSGTELATAIHGGPTLAVDYDRDGLTDIVSLSFGSANPVRVHLFRARPDGGFDPKATHELPLTIAASPSIRIRNGVLEMLTGDHSGHLAVLRVTAADVSMSLLDAGPESDLNHLFADVNEDGVADVVDTNFGSENGENPFEWIFVTLGTADGGLLQRRQLPHSRQVDLPSELRAADVDGDGHLDLIVGGFHAPTLYVYRGDGMGNFAAGIPIPAGAPVNSLAVADLNADTRPDLITANTDRTVSVILNQACAGGRRRAVRH